ncbi:DUF2461 domain-containing protein [Bacteroidales bacterium OttesenSCG-928-M11]|nr:DUF2461 domain-containing protein [Bacteroidales bacterium OttesenSCG-928-M11]
MNIDSFKGFTPQTFEFFKELSENNNKLWFDSHKDIYQEHIMQPLKSLAVALTPAMYEIDPQIDFRPIKMLSRIYRDIRFSPNKTPYKSHMWISFQRPTNKLDNKEAFPGYYLEIGAEGVNYCMGIWMPKKKIMDRFRDQIIYSPDTFKEITKDLETKHQFELRGDTYKRKIENDLPEYFQTWIQRKEIFLLKGLPIKDILFSNEFIQYMEQEFALLTPLYELFIDVCE